MGIKSALSKILTDLFSLQRAFNGVQQVLKREWFMNKYCETVINGDIFVRHLRRSSGYKNHRKMVSISTSP